MKLFDTHAHLTDERFRDDLADVLERMREGGIARAVVVGDASDEGAAAAVLKLAAAHDPLYAALGVHPHDASRWETQVARRLEGYLARPKVMALGEIGLDFHYDFSPRDAQRAAFDAQLEMAHRLGKPCVLHIREAHGEAAELLAARHRAGTLPRCVMHCYSGSWESAKQYLGMGMYISFTGVITFKNAAKLVEVAQKMPIERLMIETDCPYMAPEPLRGRRNQPAHVAHTAARIAQLRGMTPEALAEAAFDNGSRFFGID
ncbi:MAG: TatD family hydrolase [Christensenellaceae bacterium]|nr:TatD family hydrolase [Christensenellaceae bacterium]